MKFSNTVYVYKRKQKKNPQNIKFSFIILKFKQINLKNHINIKLIIFLKCSYINFKQKTLKYNRQTDIKSI